MINEVLTCNINLYLAIPLVFLIGSIPFGLIFTKRLDVDIRKTGSRNIGATNVLRSAGRMPALLTLAGDLLKGMIPAVIMGWILSDASRASNLTGNHLLYYDTWVGITGLSAVLGHMYSAFLGFRGGKGVATGFGFLIIYNPLGALITLLIWILTVALTRIVSLGAIIAVGLMPGIFILQNQSIIRVIVSFILAVLIIFKHKSNIKNLFYGTESRLGEKSK